jgi:hypothetical protein
VDSPYKTYFTKKMGRMSLWIKPDDLVYNEIMGTCVRCHRTEYIMKKEFFEELKGVSRNNELREVLLMNGVKKILTSKRRKNGLQRLVKKFLQTSKLD